MTRRAARWALTAVITAGLASVAGCETGSTPLENSIANFQAAATDVSPQLAIRDARIFVPDDAAAPGETVYLMFAAVNHGSEPDTLLAADLTVTSQGPTPTAIGTPAATTAPTVPPATSTTPGFQRISVPIVLQEPLHAGETVRVSLDFQRGGPVDGLLVPVASGSAAGTFLPTPSAS